MMPSFVEFFQQQPWMEQAALANFIMIAILLASSTRLTTWGIGLPHKHLRIFYRNCE